MNTVIRYKEGQKYNVVSSPRDTTKYHIFKKIKYQIYGANLQETIGKAIVLVDQSKMFLCKK